MTYGAVILAGGRSRRMGTDKAKLDYGGKTFLEKLAFELAGFDERLLSVAEADDRSPLPGFETVADIYKNKGPIGGLFTALSVCRSDALLSVSCDLPLFEKAFADYLVSRMDGCDVLLPQSADGHMHPLCAVWRKSCAPALAAHLRCGDCRLMNAVDDLNVKYIAPGEFARCLTNVNTREDYKTLFSKGEKP